jgi:sugar/nucleoside kinase (ribokinase family)
MPAHSHPAPLRSLSIGGATFDVFVATAAGTKKVDNQEMLLLPLGQKVRASGVHGRSGGGACNTATALARLGLHAGCCAVIGDDQWGQLLLNQMEREHVHTEYLTVVEDETSSFSLVFSAASGERVIVYSAGTNEHLRPATLDAAALAAADVVYLNHIQPDSCTIEDPIVDALHLNRAIRLTWNPGGCQIDAGLREAGNRRLLERTDILLLNKEEALAFAGVGDVDTALRTLLQTGTKIVCVTDGKRGAVATDGKTLYSCPIAPAPVVDTTGAGDAFGAGFT